MAKRTVAEIMASTGPINVTVDLGDGWQAPVSLDGSVGAAPTVDVEDLVSAVVGGRQKLDKQGRIKVKGPDVAITADGVVTDRTGKRSAPRLPHFVAAALYASVGADVPDDLLTPDGGAENAARTAAQLEANRAARGKGRKGKHQANGTPAAQPEPEPQANGTPAPAGSAG